MYRESLQIKCSTDVRLVFLMLPQAIFSIVNESPRQKWKKLLTKEWDQPPASSDAANIWMSKHRASEEEKKQYKSFLCL